MSIKQASIEVPAVHDALEKLRSLQDVLYKKHEIEGQIQELPKALATRTEQLNELKRSYVDRNEEQASVTTRIEVLRNDALESERVREGYEGQMDQIRTQREYEALDKQIRDAADREMDFRRQLGEEEELLVQISDELTKSAEQIEVQEGEVNVEDSRIKTELSEREQRLGELKGEEEEIAKGLDKDLLFKFERIVRSTEGYGIVPLRGQVCTGCFMTLPAHFVNRVRRAEDVLFCTHGRIVFYQDALPEDEAEGQLDVFDDEPGFFAVEDEESKVEAAENPFLDVAESDGTEPEED